MTNIYVMKATYERNANDGIEHFTDMTKLAEAVVQARDLGATYVRVYRCVEVNFNAYWGSACIEIGTDRP